MDDQSSSQLQERWDRFCCKHELENSQVRIDEVDGELLLHADVLVSDSLHAFVNPNHLTQSLTAAGLRLLHFDVQGNIGSMAVSVL